MDNRSLTYCCEKHEIYSDLQTRVDFCPFCGMQQSMNLVEETRSIDVDVAEFDHLISKLDDAGVEQYVDQLVQGTYCDTPTFMSMARHYARHFNVTPAVARIHLADALERRNIVNEERLIFELETALRIYTEDDGKLDKKEYHDALQQSCRPRRGYAKGLDMALAQQCVIDYCRLHKIKMKTGYFTWSVP